MPSKPDRERVIASLDIAEPLKPSEKSALRTYEKIIADGLRPFVQVGLALAMIRDHRLYRAEFPTFEQYCAARWDFTDRRARQLIDSAKIVSTLDADGPSGTIVPKHESHARPLLGLSLAQQRKAWKAAVKQAGDNPMKAAIVRAAVRKVTKTAEAKQPAPRPEWGLTEAIDRIHVATADAFARWPKEYMHVLVSKLHDLADEIEKTGRVRR